MTSAIFVFSSFRSIVSIVSSSAVLYRIFFLPVLLSFSGILGCFGKEEGWGGGGGRGGGGITH